jgi:uridine kinase
MSDGITGSNARGKLEMVMPPEGLRKRGRSESYDFTAAKKTHGKPPLTPALGKKIIVVGIVGGTGSGKTTVATAIRERLGSLAVLCHDSYYRDLQHLPMAERAEVNFDHPNSLETSLMVEHLTKLKRGEAVNVPQYEFATYARVAETTPLGGNPELKIIIVEGILAYVDKELRDMMDIKIFVDTEADVRLIRRLQRDIAERGRTVESVVGQYMKTVKPMHDQFVEPTKRFADVIIPAGLNSVALELVIARLEQMASDL